VGALPLAALAMALGANLGEALNLGSEVAGDADPAAKLLPFGNLFNRANGVAVTLEHDEFNAPVILPADSAAQPRAR